MTKHLHIQGKDGRMEVVAWFDDFDGPHPFQALSNFYVGAPFTLPGLGGIGLKTGEHAYAAMKAWGIDGNRNFFQIVNAPDPQSAKTLGRTCKMRRDWEEVKYDVMMAVLRSKFKLDREEGDILLNTGDALLIEGTYWYDQVWGVDLNAMGNPTISPGRNWLGTMLMARRAELRAESYFEHTTIAGNYNADFALRR